MDLHSRAVNHEHFSFQERHPFFLIPKPFKGDSVVDSKKLWRIDFHVTEREILIGYSKNIVKFLKVKIVHMEQDMKAGSAQAKSCCVMQHMHGIIP